MRTGMQQHVWCSHVPVGEVLAELRGEAGHRTVQQLPQLPGSTSRAQGKCPGMLQLSVKLLQ